ncbi:multidrug effflux MFS transporter [Actinomycetospora sp. TBRC 11914]|uniref:multidrug effflux MFS transporter n=1 Tax=Actinomycetospora sp. TBRC 11914 TaxID=2729387 RepID=UPI00145D8E05|nr:multidrug effflux MFS transporter [Actinomycetospora sp. TBRC 11914]NMO92840.1 multidrug effflux MFS transporter [Actinomycetospora sp. TBRC 11914]
MSGPPGRLRRVARTAVLGGLTGVAPLSIDTYLPALPGVTRDLRASAPLVALTLTAVVVGLAVGQLVAGPLSDVLGRRGPLLAGAVGFAVLSGACALAPDVGTLVVLRLGQGLLGAVGIVLARAVVRDLYDGPAAARGFAALMLVSGVAPIVAPVVGGQLLRVTSWRGVFVVLAVLGAVLAVGVLAAVPETLPRAARARGDGAGGAAAGLRTTATAFRILLADRRVLACVSAAGLGFAAMFAYISGSTFVLQGLYGLSPQAFSGVFAVNSVGIVAATQVAGRLVAAGRLAPARAVAIGLVTACTGSTAVLVGALTPAGPWALVPGLFVTVCGVGFVLPSATTLALAGHPSRAGSASALLGTSQFLVGGFTSPLVGIGGGRSAVPMGTTMVVAAVLGLVVFALVWRRAPSVDPDAPDPAGSARATAVQPSDN